MILGEKKHLNTVSLGSQSRCLLRKPVSTSASASARTMAVAESIGNRKLLEIKHGSFGDCKLCSPNNMNSVLSGYFLTLYRSIPNLHYNKTLFENIK